VSSGCRGQRLGWQGGSVRCWERLCRLLRLYRWLLLLLLLLLLLSKSLLLQHRQMVLLQQLLMVRRSVLRRQVALHGWDPRHRSGARACHRRWPPASPDRLWPMRRGVLDDRRVQGRRHAAARLRQRRARQRQLRLCSRRLQRHRRSGLGDRRGGLMHNSGSRVAGVRRQFGNDLLLLFVPLVLAPPVREPALRAGLAASVAQNHEHVRSLEWVGLDGGTQGLLRTETCCSVRPMRSASACLTSLGGNWTTAPHTQ
jgi:hypothetical protein